MPRPLTHLRDAGAERDIRGLDLLPAGSFLSGKERSVIEMTRMIDVTRTYTAIAGMLQTHGDLRRTAIERLAEVPA